VGGSTRRWHGRWHGMAIVGIAADTTFAVNSKSPQPSTSSFGVVAGIGGRIQIFKTVEAGVPRLAGSIPVRLRHLRKQDPFACIRASRSVATSRSAPSQPQVDVRPAQRGQLPSRAPAATPSRSTTRRSGCARPPSAALLPARATASPSRSWGRLAVRCRWRGSGRSASIARPACACGAGLGAGARWCAGAARPACRRGGLAPELGVQVGQAGTVGCSLGSGITLLLTGRNRRPHRGQRPWPPSVAGPRNRPSREPGSSWSAWSAGSAGG
jgi:hypothetical protein